MALSSPCGAYGLRVEGLETTFLNDLSLAETWLSVAVSRLDEVPRSSPARLSDEVAEVPLLDGDRVLFDRRARSATLVSASPFDDATMVHPFLTTVAVIFSWWDGRQALHGGALLGADGAWLVLGERGAGKSSTLARIAFDGATVLSDDLLVIERGLLFAGPRCLDLRRDAAEAFGGPWALASVRDGERCRITLPRAPLEVPVRGSCFLSWADTIELQPLGPSERLERLARHHSIPSHGTPSLLGSAALPAVELRRPPRWDSLEPAVERLREFVGV